MIAKGRNAPTTTDHKQREGRGGNGRQVVYLHNVDTPCSDRNCQQARKSLDYYAPRAIDGIRRSQRKTASQTNCYKPGR